MPDWKNITESAEKKRAAAFEAQMLAMLAKDQPAAVEKSAAPVTPKPPAVPARDGIQITVTANGETAHYFDLEGVPSPVRQQILNAWQTEQQSKMPEPPVLPVARPRSRRVAMALNLVLPGAGQFYLRQRVAGSVYAFGFLACFVTMLVIFFRGYGDYVQVSTGDEIFEPGNLEHLTQSFHTGWLAALQIVALVIYIASAIHLSRSAART